MLHYVSSDKPARAYHSTLTKGAKPEVFKWTTEWIEEARDRQQNLPKEIAYLMNNIQARFNHLSDTNPKETLKKINKVRRLIGQSMLAQIEFAKELQELAEYEAKLSQ